MVLTLNNYLEMIAIIFGASGSLGKQLVKSFDDLSIEVVPKSRPDFTADWDVGEIISCIESVNANAVINCAAMTGLAACYKNKSGAHAINVAFSQALSAAAFLTGLKYFNFSTEYVFPCDQDGKIYAEDDVERPLTNYGLTKYLGEPKRSLRNAHTIRLPLLYGPTHGSQIIGRLLNKIREGGTAWAATDIYSTPVCSIDVAKFLGEVICKNVELPNIVHLHSEQLISLFETLSIIADLEQCDGTLVRGNSADQVGDVFKPPYGGLKSAYVSALPSVSENIGII